MAVGDSLILPRSVTFDHQFCETQWRHSAKTRLYITPSPILHSVKRSDVTRWKQGYIRPPPPYFIVLASSVKKRRSRSLSFTEFVSKHTTTLFSLSDHYILSREWRIIVHQGPSVVLDTKTEWRVLIDNLTQRDMKYRLFESSKYWGLKSSFTPK